jgi:hypothetical protein
MKNDGPVKDPDCVFEIDAVLRDIKLALPFVPVEPVDGFVIILL